MQVMKQTCVCVRCFPRQQYEGGRENEGGVIKSEVCAYKLLIDFAKSYFTIV